MFTELNKYVFALALSQDGNTPLMLAIQRKLPKVVEMLLEKGADVSLRNKVGPVLKII